jgi:hypothetical protein
MRWHWAIDQADDLARGRTSVDQPVFSQEHPTNRTLDLRAAVRLHD